MSGLKEGDEQVSDLEIACLILEGEDRGLELLLQKHGGKVRGVLYGKYSQVLGGDMLDQLIFDGATKMWEGIENFDDTKGTLSGYFYIICHHLVMDVLRGRNKDRELGELLEEVQKSCDLKDEEEECLPDDSLIVDLYTVLSSLPKLQREIIKADLASGEKVAESNFLAEQHGTSRNSIIVSRNKARKKIREGLIALGYNESCWRKMT